MKHESYLKESNWSAQVHVWVGMHTCMCACTVEVKRQLHVIPQVLLTVLLRQTLLLDWNHQFGHNGRQPLKFKDHVLSASPAQRL